MRGIREARLNLKPSRNGINRCLIICLPGKEKVAGQALDVRVHTRFICNLVPLEIGTFGPSRCTGLLMEDRPSFVYVYECIYVCIRCSDKF